MYTKQIPSNFIQISYMKLKKYERKAIYQHRQVSTAPLVVITTYVWLRTSASGRSTRLARLKVTFKIHSARGSTTVIIDTWKCLFTTVAFLLLAQNCGPFAARSAGGMPLAVSRRRTFLFNICILLFSNIQDL